MQLEHLKQAVSQSVPVRQLSREGNLDALVAPLAVRAVGYAERMTQWLAHDLHFEYRPVQEGT